MDVNLIDATNLNSKKLSRHIFEHTFFKYCFDNIYMILTFQQLGCSFFPSHSPDIKYGSLKQLKTLNCFL